MSSFKATLIGKVVFIDAKLGGRRTPVGSGYRGQFFYNGMDCDAIHTFETQGNVPFGEEVVDHIYLPNPDHTSQICEGMIFLIREGPQTVGYGRVIAVSGSAGK